MTANEFVDLCYALWGDDWVYSLHKRLDISTRSIKRWANGAKPVPVEVAGIIRFMSAKAGQQ